MLPRGSLIPDSARDLPAKGGGNYSIYTVLQFNASLFCVPPRAAAEASLVDALGASACFGSSGARDSGFRLCASTFTRVQFSPAASRTLPHGVWLDSRVLYVRDRVLRSNGQRAAWPAERLSWPRPAWPCAGSQQRNRYTPPSRTKWTDIPPKPSAHPPPNFLRSSPARSRT